MKRRLNNAFTFAVILLAGLVAYRFLSPRLFPAPTPAVFSEGTSLTAALTRAQSTGKPVFAVATASWCGACQSYKKNALVNPEVEARLTDNTIPVFIDIDKDTDAATALNISSVPATFLINADGSVIAQLQGNTPSGALITWLDTNTPPIASNN